jgi:hypothetical protein
MPSEFYLRVVTEGDGSFVHPLEHITKITIVALEVEYG